MSNTILRSNPQNVPLEHIKGMRLLSVEEAAILAQLGGLRQTNGRSIIPDEQLFIWTFFEEWSNLCDGSLAQYRTYATTRPEGYYLQFKKN